MNIEEIYDLELKYQEVYKRTKDYTRNDFVIELIKKEDEKQEIIEYLKEKKNELYKKLSDYNDLARIGEETDIEFFEALILERKIDVYEEILSKIEKR